jgi:phospholipid N-methyltransferase
MIKHLQHIRTSGTIIRSSPYLISRLLRPIDFGRARTIVQLGVGTGCITRELLRRLHPSARLVSIEVNEVFVREGRRIRDPRLTVLHACASDLRALLDTLGIDRIDHVVSSLPLAIMDDRLVERILAGTESCLEPDGLFLQYQYSLSQRAALERWFGDVRVGFTLANIPPAFVYECSLAR